MRRRVAATLAACLVAAFGTWAGAASAAPGTTCPAVNLWGYDHDAGTIVQLAPSGAVVSSAPAARAYGDIAWSADGNVLYGVEFNTLDPKLYTIDPATGAETAAVPITGVDPLVSGTFNGLSTLADGRLFAQSALSQGFFAVDPATAVATQLLGWLPGADHGSGDGVQLPDGDFLVLGSADGVAVYAFRLHPDHTVTRLGRLPITALGVALSGGQSYFFGTDGSVRSLAAVPTASSSDPLALTIVKAPDAGSNFWGASSIQDSGLCNVDTDMSYTVAKAAAPGGPVAPGGVVTYTVTVANTGSTDYPATTAGIADAMAGVLDDAALVPGSVTATAGSVTVDGDRLLWIGPLAAAGEPGSTVTVTYQVRVNDPRTGDGALVNTVAPTGAGGACASATACSSRVSVTAPPSTGAPPATSVPPAAPWLKLSKKPDHSTVPARGKVRFTITVRNPSHQTARDVRVCDVPNAGFAYVGKDAKASVSKGRVCWRVKRLGPNANRAFHVSARALRGTRGRKASAATAVASNAGSVRAKAVVRVLAERRANAVRFTG